MKLPATKEEFLATVDALERSKADDPIKRAKLFVMRRIGTAVYKCFEQDEFDNALVMIALAESFGFIIGQVVKANVREGHWPVVLESLLKIVDDNARSFGGGTPEREH